MNRRLLALCAAVLAAGLLPAALARPTGTPTSGVSSAAGPTTLILTVELDHRGARVLQATRKPGLRFRAPRHADAMPFRWTLRGADGAVLADGGFDPARVCMDPAHAGQPPHVEGCEVIPHLAHANVKVPDLGAAATLEFARRDGAVLVPLGSVPCDALPIR